MVKYNGKNYPVLHKFDIYKQGALPDTMFLTTSDKAKNALTQLTHITDCCLDKTNIFHPETAFGKFLRLQDFEIIEMGVVAFPQLFK
jgi:hypothetical protein